jgi:hypothetical protein
MDLQLRTKMLSDLRAWRGRGKSVDEAVHLVWAKYLPADATELTGVELDAFIGAQVDLLGKEGVTVKELWHRVLKSE